MSSRCTFLLQYFGDRHILLKDEWLNSVIDFLHTHVPQSTRFSDEQFANLVLDQWLCSNIEKTSFPVFGNHGIDVNVQKQRLHGPIVCQANGFIDTGSSYYQQFNNLSGNGKKEDNSGFEKVFHEKEDDTDRKPSRLLKLTLTDGESTLIAIEFWKCPQLSLHCKPGTKILVEPPCDIRRGTFLLKPNNCKILGGEVLPQLSRYLPLEQYAKILQIKDFKQSTSANKKTAANDRRSAGDISQSGAASTSTSSASTSFTHRSTAPSGPSAMISRYFSKKPPSCTPSTSKAPEPQEISPDVMAGSEFDENVFEEENLVSDYANRQSTPRKYIENRRKSGDSVHISSLLSRIQADDEEFETTRRVTPKIPKKRESVTASPTDATRRISGMLTSRRVDPMDELLENMIEKDEEPVSCPEKTTSKNPFKAQSQPPMKKVKVEADSDDDIQIIELVTPPPANKKQKTPEKIVEKREKEADEKDDLSAEERAAVRAFSSLKLSPLTESIKKMRFSVGSKRFHLLAFIEDIADPLRVVDQLWTMKVKLKDDTGETEAFIDNQTLQNLIGYTCEEAMAVRKSSDLEKRKDGKRRLEALEQQLQRLDLVFEIEFFAGSNPSCPVIRSMKTLAEKLDVY